MSRSATFHDFCNPTAAEEAAFLRNVQLGRGGFRGGDLPSTPEDDLPLSEGGGDTSSVNGQHRRNLLANNTFSSWLQLLLSKKRRGNIMSFSHRPSLMRPSISLSVVHETNALGSDGESIEVSPCTSDQMSTSSHGHSSCGNNINGEHHQRYIPNVKLRSKPNNRRWSEQDIQKRLSLPADIKLPQNVVEKLNRTPTLDNPLTRKSRRASLETTTSNSRSDLIGSLFGSGTTTKREKKSVENLFGTSTTNTPAITTRPNTVQASSRKRPTVTFQDPPVTDSRNTIPTETKPETTKPPSTDLLDSLFTTSSLTGNRRRQPETNTFTQRPASTVSGRRTNDFLDENPSQRPESTQNRQNDAEIENLRREISTLKYEKSEDQETIQKLQANISKLKDEHNREIEQINRRHRDEIETLNKKHEVEISQVEKTERAQADILASISEYQNIFKNVIDRIETIQSSTSTIQEQVGLIKDKNEETEHVIEFANHQVEEAQKRLYKELEEWEERKRQNNSAIELEFEKLTKTYNEEIVEGRKWIQRERDKLYAEKRAFQEEQTNIIVTFENRKEELDELKSEFLKKEHDLLVRVVNERSTLQQQQREFELQRNADIIRLRKEAEELEVCFAQVQNALSAIESIRKDYELKNRHLQINVDMISEHLPLHLQNQIKL